METVLIVVIILQALTLGLLLYALLQANKKKRELEALLRPILDIASRVRTQSADGGFSFTKAALDTLFTQIGKASDSPPAVKAPQSSARKLADLAEDPAVRETVDKTARTLKSLFKPPADAADDGAKGSAEV